MKCFVFCFFGRFFFFFSFAWHFVKCKIIWPTCAVSEHESFFFSWGKKQEHIFLCYCGCLSLLALELCLIWKICADSGLAGRGLGGLVGMEERWSSDLKCYWIVHPVLIEPKDPNFGPPKKSFTFLSCLCFQMNAFPVLFKQHFDKEQRAQLKFLWVPI